MTSILPQCFVCKHIIDKNAYIWTCEAFPNGIPESIIWNKHDHRLIYPGDNGIQFEPTKREAKILTDNSLDFSGLNEND